MARPKSKSPAPRPAAKVPAKRPKGRPTQRVARSTSTPEAAKSSQKVERIGLLIDADNVSHQHLPTLRRFIGTTAIAAARAYGDFQGRLFGWREAAQGWPELQLVDQRSYTPGKNAADMRLTIDAVKLMAEANPPTTLIFVTNDSDFTPVVEDAQRLGVRIIVMGERTHQALRTTANHYLNLSELRARFEEEDRQRTDPKVALALLSKALRLLAPKGKTEFIELLDQFDKKLPEIIFGSPRAPQFTREPREPRHPRAPRPAPMERAPRPQPAPRAPRHPHPVARPAQAVRPAAPVPAESLSKADADRRRTQLLARPDIINAVVDVAGALMPPGEWIKVEAIRKVLFQEYPGLDRNAPRYDRFHEMLEDTGKFRLKFEGPVVFAQLQD